MDRPSPTLVLFAMASERRGFRGRPGPGLAIRVSGVGMANARREAESALGELRPARVFTCGVAGALDPALQVGDVLFETRDASLARLLCDAGARAARFHCAERIAVTAREKQQLRLQTGCDAVEMESAVIHEACASRGIPCATVRSISDLAGEDLPLDFNRLATPQQTLSPGRLAVAILRSPGCLPGLIRLGRHSATASRRLGELLERVLVAS